MIQPAIDKEYHHVSAVLKDSGTCLFNLSPHGAQLQPILFGSRSCTDFERKYRSFVGEPPVANGVLVNISHVSGAFIFGGYVTVQT